MTGDIVRVARDVALMLDQPPLNAHLRLVVPSLPAAYLQGDVSGSHVLDQFRQGLAKPLDLLRDVRADRESKEHKNERKRAIRDGHSGPA